jgi:hypothetical protein
MLSSAVSHELAVTAKSRSRRFRPLNDGASATLATGATDVDEVIVTLATNGVLRMIMEAPVSAAARVEHHLFNWPGRSKAARGH